MGYRPFLQFANRYPTIRIGPFQIVIKSDDWFNTHIKLQKKRLDTIMKNFRRPPDRAFVDMDPLSAGSFYRLDTNYIGKEL